MAARNLDAVVERSICEDRETPILLMLSPGRTAGIREINVERPSSLVAPADIGVAGLSATAGVEEKSSYLSTPEMPVVELLNHIN